MAKVYCQIFNYISCRGNKSVMYEIPKPTNPFRAAQISTIVEFEENCPKRVMKNVGSGYLYASYDLLKLCDKSRIIYMGTGWFDVSEEEEEEGN